jgi:hypothetical protein
MDQVNLQNVDRRQATIAGKPRSYKWAITAQ